MSSSFRPLLAKPAADLAAESRDATAPPVPGPSSAAAPIRLEPRQCVGAACDTCRLKKTKCDATRPICQTCRKRGWVCYYATMPGETRNMSLKREVGKLRAVSEELSRLFDYLRLADRSEANAALEQIRNGLSPMEVLSAAGALSPFLPTAGPGPGPGPGPAQDALAHPAPVFPGGGGGGGDWGPPVASFARGDSWDDAAAAPERYALRPAGPRRGAYAGPVSQHAEAAPWPIPPTTKSTPDADGALWPAPMDHPPASSASAAYPPPSASAAYPPPAAGRPWPPGGPDDVVMPASL